MAGAVLHAPLPAQARPDTIPKKRDTTLTVPLPARGDSLLRDTLAKRDSLHPPEVKRDSIKAPLAHAELPAVVDIARRWHWSKDSLAATGAVTLADLIERVPGLITFRAGWLASPSNAAYLGDVHRVRVFYDGVAMDALDPRSGGALDLSQINLWAVEDAVIEQEAEEVRVYLRSWRVNSTTAYTRTDVATGDQQSNLYRGFFGRRFDNGAAIQLGAQQFGTTPPSVFGTSSDQLGIVARAGWASTNWSIDSHLSRTSRHRGAIYGEVRGDSIPATESARSDAYVRVGYHDPDTSAVWWQAMAVASGYNYTGVRTRIIAKPLTAADTAFNNTSLDTAAFRSQYIATAGTVRGPLRLSGTARLFGSSGTHVVTPSARASFVTNRLAVSAFVEGKSADSIARSDVTVRLAPLSFVSLLAGAGRAADDRVADSSFSATYLRAEAGLRIKNLWLLGGVIRRDSVRLSPPHVFDTLFTTTGERSATGVTAAIRGQLWRLLNADVSAVRWSDSLGFYRPRYETRSQLFARTNLRSRFPSGHLGLMGSVIHEYRSGTRFPVAGGVIDVPGYRTISTLVEIRIISATISWQFRNVLGERYSQVPSFIMPRQTNFYGVRWEFFN